MDGTNRAKTLKELIERRSALAGELARLTAPPEAGANLSFGKRIGEGTSAAVDRINDTAAARALAAALDDVERSLVKLDEGTYGRCDACGGPISEERLDAIPGTALCVACSRRRSR